MAYASSRLFIIAAGLAALTIPSLAQTDADAAALVATQVRDQGFACAEPVSAEQDANADGDAVWVLTCGNASYRVRLVPDQAAAIETLD